MPPVEDHAVHEKVRHTDLRSTPCQTGKRKHGYSVLTRHYFDDGRYELRNEFVPDTMSPLCRQIDALPECVGCEKPKDLEYIEKMKGLK